jgi:hypothetical protein
MDQAKWDAAIAHAREYHQIYLDLPVRSGFFGAPMIGGLIRRYEGGERTKELLEELEGVE